MRTGGRPLYDRIGSGYDVTRRADPYIAGRLFHHLRPVPEAAYIDVACGMYLSEVVRRGISTFASVADSEKARAGSAQLGSDIESGRIESVIREYEHAKGDYLFVIAERAAGF
jgi:hypothetical protein